MPLCGQLTFFINEEKIGTKSYENVAIAIHPAQIIMFHRSTFPSTGPAARHNPMLSIVL